MLVYALIILCPGWTKMLSLRSFLLKLIMLAFLHPLCIGLFFVKGLKHPTNALLY